MRMRKLIKLIHLAGLIWLVLCLLYITVLVLMRAGVQLWVIYSLSGYTFLLSLLLISLYLFAVYRGVARSQKIEIEHPLTTSDYYILFFVSAPLLGGLTGFFGGIGASAIVFEFLLEISLASLGTAFLVWVVLDPIVGFIEVLTPKGRKHRFERLAQARIEREQKQKAREQLLAEVIQKDEQSLRRQQELLTPLAERLAELLNTKTNDFEYAEAEATDMGVKAWQIGGLSCMRQLREMTINIYSKKCTDLPINDYLSSWWDGIGSWRNPSLG